MQLFSKKLRSMVNIERILPFSSKRNLSFGKLCSDPECFPSLAMIDEFIVSLVKGYILF